MNFVLPESEYISELYITRGILEQLETDGKFNLQFSSLVYCSRKRM
jgi:hypothetical protein